MFKGNKRPVAKECVLIIDHDTGTYVLEKINQGVALKKTRYFCNPTVMYENLYFTAIEIRIDDVVCNQKNIRAAKVLIFIYTFL